MNLLLFFAAVTLIIVAQCVFLSLLVRFTLARLYSDLKAWFTPQKEGQPSQFGIVVNGLVDNIAASISTKAKMSMLGEVGGKAPKTMKFTGNKFIDGIINAAAPAVLNKVLGGSGVQMPFSGGNGSHSDPNYEIKS